MAAPSKRGRPPLGDAARVTLNVRVAPATAEAIFATAVDRGTSRGAIVDEIVTRTLLRKRKA